MKMMMKMNRGMVMMDDLLVHYQPLTKATERELGSALVHWEPSSLPARAACVRACVRA